MSTWPTEVALLSDLVAIPSLSGDETTAAEFVESAARRFGLDVVRDETSVRVEVGSAHDGPTLALATHLDVVPPGEGWSRDPFTPVIEDGKLYGRGSGDAKASVAAMLTALSDLKEVKLSGRVLGLFTYGEETRDATMPAAVPRAEPLDAAIVGEPTNLRAAVGQRGLMMVDLIARGSQRHAGHVGSGGFVNAIMTLARQLERLDPIVAERRHPVLGLATITPTMLEAGVSRNVTPPEARAVLDIRSTPMWTHQELGEALRQALDCEVVVTSDRLVPCETPADSKLLPAINRAIPGLESYGSPTCSDWCHLRHLDVVKLGPGTSSRSHTADEAVNVAEVTAARSAYAAIAREFLG